MAMTFKKITPGIWNFLRRRDPLFYERAKEPGAVVLIRPHWLDQKVKVVSHFC